MVLVLWLVHLHFLLKSEVYISQLRQSTRLRLESWRAGLGEWIRARETYVRGRYLSEIVARWTGGMP